METPARLVHFAFQSVEPDRDAERRILSALCEEKRQGPIPAHARHHRVSFVFICAGNGTTNSRQIAGTTNTLDQRVSRSRRLPWPPKCIRFPSPARTSSP
ncbi:hypothetical protein GR257_25175 [Rhizobium leguminosarum]|uniref:Uncharacterized protein n=1 Tax=Rhizobium leguminosarum TaxID=384 RepID=A0A7K3VNP4_RHILE|nr:hypothetical protein [Rhizobium leguminosarum]